MIPYNPRSWYYVADDGRVFSCSRCAIVTTDDEAYKAFIIAAAPGTAHLWPKDAAGAQTDDSLDDELAAIGLSTSGPLRSAYGYDILNVLTDDERAASLSSSVKTWDRLMIQARPTPFPEANEKVARLAKGIGTTPKALFDRALGAGA